MDHVTANNGIRMPIDASLRRLPLEHLDPFHQQVESVAFMREPGVQAMVKRLSEWRVDI